MNQVITAVEAQTSAEAGKPASGSDLHCDLSIDLKIDDLKINLSPERILEVREQDDGALELTLDLHGMTQWQMQSDAIIHSLTLNRCQQLQQLDLSDLDGPRFLYLNACDRLQQLNLAGPETARWLDQPQLHLMSPAREAGLALTIDGAVHYLDADFAGQRFDSYNFTGDSPWRGVDLLPLSAALSQHPSGPADAERLLILTGGPDEPQDLSLSRHYLSLMLVNSTQLTQLHYQAIASPDQPVQLVVNNARTLTHLACPEADINCYARQTPALSELDFATADFISLGDIHSPQLQLLGAVKHLLLTQVRTGHLHAQQVDHLELQNSGRIQQFSLPALVTLTIMGAKPTALNASGNLYINEASLQLMADAYDENPEQTLDDYRSLIVHGADKKIALILLRLLWIFYRKGLDPETVWTLRCELNAANVPDTAAWRWNLPNDLRVEGWTMDYRLWLAACKQLPQAQAYHKAICRTLKQNERGYPPVRDARRLAVKYLLPELQEVSADHSTDGKAPLTTLPEYQHQVLRAVLQWGVNAVDRGALLQLDNIGDLDLILRHLASSIANAGSELYQLYLDQLISTLKTWVSDDDSGRVDQHLALLIQVLSPQYLDDLCLLPALLISEVSRCRPGPNRWTVDADSRVAQQVQRVQAFALTELRRSIQAMNPDQTLSFAEPEKKLPDTDQAMTDEEREAKELADHLKQVGCLSHPPSRDRCLDLPDFLLRKNNDKGDS